MVQSHEGELVHPPHLTQEATCKAVTRIHIHIAEFFSCFQVNDSHFSRPGRMSCCPPHMPHVVPCQAGGI